jgi:hypothetical protein
MLSLIKTVFLTATLFLTTHVAQAYNVNLALKPKEDKVLSNSSLWTITATCQIKSSANKKTIKIRGNKDGSRVNGKTLTAGQATSLTIYAEKTIEVTAEPGAEVTISNMSDEPFIATCSA